MLIVEQKKFSAIAYANVLQTEWQRSQSSDHRPPHADEALNQFNRLAIEIRNILVASKGKTEEEKWAHHETLNKAILGFEDERRKLLASINDLLTKKRLHDLPPPNRKYSTLAEALFAEVIGLNVLELILKQREGLEEIQVVGKNIFEVRQGLAAPSVFQFPSIKEVERIQQNLVLFNSDTLNPRKKWAEVMLHDGSRVTMTGFGYTAEPTLTIRFYIVKHYDLQILLRPEYETIAEKMIPIIHSLIHGYFNLVIIGPTNSGKTNLIKAFIACMPDHERVITIETRFELMLKRDFPNKNIIEYEVDEGDDEHSGRQAFKLALRQSPQRICHAEIRDEDANIYVRSCTRGHEGSITTVHANELEDVPDAITDMCMLDRRGMDPSRLRQRITAFVTQIGFEMAIVDGKRKIVRIGEFSYRNGEVIVRDIAKYNYASNQWEYPQQLSHQAARRIMKHHMSGYLKLLELRLIEPC